jgi:hypothetical protein
VAFGGKKKDNGHSAVQMCDGYLLAGITESNNKKQSCSLCQVSCNHYDCTDTSTEDFWIAKINGNGELIWNESLGASGNDGAYVIKQVSSDTYIIGGYTTSSNGDKDWYLVKFSISDCNERLSKPAYSYNHLLVYPNPSSDFFAISLTFPEKINETATLEVLNVEEKVVAEHMIAIENGLLYKVISIQHFSSGFYSVRIILKDRIYQTKLLLQKEL